MTPDAEHRSRVSDAQVPDDDNAAPRSAGPTGTWPGLVVCRKLV